MARIMKARAVWFAAGSAAGVYATAKARRAAYRLSMPGFVDQAAALGLGWRSFSAELRDGMDARERDVAHRLVATEVPETLRLDAAATDPTRPEQRND